MNTEQELAACSWQEGAVKGPPLQGPLPTHILGRGQSSLAATTRRHFKIHTHCEACPVPWGQGLMVPTLKGYPFTPGASPAQTWVPGLLHKVGRGCLPHSQK